MRANSHLEDRTAMDVALLVSVPSGDRDWRPLSGCAPIARCTFHAPGMRPSLGIDTRPGDADLRESTSRVGCRGTPRLSGVIGATGCYTPVEGGMHWASARHRCTELMHDHGVITPGLAGRAGLRSCEVVAPRSAAWQSHTGAAPREQYRRLNVRLGQDQELIQRGRHQSGPFAMAVSATSCAINNGSNGSGALSCRSGGTRARGTHGRATYRAWGRDMRGRA
jgi:hypothetical protein